MFACVEKERLRWRFGRERHNGADVDLTEHIGVLPGRRSGTVEEVAATDQVADTDNIKHFTYENRDYASVIIPKSMWGPEAELRYLKQGDTYRLQLANDLTGEELAARFRRAGTCLRPTAMTRSRSSPCSVPGTPTRWRWSR